MQAFVRPSSGRDRKPCGPVEALWPSSSFFGNGSSTVRSREKFEMQLKLTQEL